MHYCGAFTCDFGIFCMDSKTPLRVHLSAYYKRSSAVNSVKNRMRVMLTNLIDYLDRDKEQIVKEYGEIAREELKDEISKLKDEIQTNKPIPQFDSDEPYAKIYNQYLKEQSEINGKVRFFTAIWLHIGCFMYTRLRYFFDKTTNLKNFDYFRKQKQDAFVQSMNAMTLLGEYLLPKLYKKDGVDAKEEFTNLIKLNLWSNRCDLAMSSGADNSPKTDPLTTISQFEPYILSNHSDKIWELLSKPYFDASDIRIIDFINDNAGYEMFTYFCLADFIISYDLANKICFNIKAIPWFISDTTEKDFRWMLQMLISSQNPNLKKLGIRWNKYIREHVWSYRDDSFCTLPFDFTKMKTQDPELYQRLSESKLLIFKGDLNYRKLFGEINWGPSTPVNEALHGFLPTKLCTLRTIKADIICGLPKGVAAELNKIEESWMRTGNYGLIQFAG